MFNKDLVKAAHKMTREIKAKYPEVNYNLQFGLCMTYLLNNKGEVKMVEITVGSEKQIAWATEIRNANLKVLEREITELKSRSCNDSDEFIINTLNPLISKFEKAIEEMHTTNKPAAWWIEHKSIAAAYIQRAKRA